MSPEPSSRTLVLSVVAIDLVGYSRESVAEQMALKSNFNQVLLRAIADISSADRIILDTGDGVAMGFLGDPEDALYVAMYMHFNINRERQAIRIGINLGPVKLATGVGGHPNIIGDGINVAERIMTFAEPGQLTVSRPFFEVMSRMSGQYKNLFQNIGVRTDKQVRDHEVYLVGKSGSAFHLAEKGVKARASQRIVKSAPAAPVPAAKKQPWPSTVSSSGPVENNAGLIDFLEDRKKVAVTATLLAVVTLGLAATLIYRKTQPAQTEVNVPVVATVTPAITGGDGGVVTSAPPASAWPKSAAATEGQNKTDAKSAPAIASVPLAAPKATPAPAAPPAADKGASTPVTPSPVVKLPPAPVIPMRVPTRDVLKDSKTEKSEREEKLPGQRPNREETRKAIQARTAEREQSAPAAAAPVIPNLQSPIQAPRPESVAPTPSLPPPVVARPDTSAVVVERRDPAYPVEGIRQGILRTVVVKARLSIDASGSVTDVVILEGGPIAAFGRQTRLTLKEWKFNPGAPGRSIDIEITFTP